MWRRTALWRRRRRWWWRRFRTKVSVHSYCVIILFRWTCTRWCLCTFVFIFMLMFLFSSVTIGRWRWIEVHGIRIIRSYLICPVRWSSSKRSGGRRSSKRSGGRSSAIKYKLFSCKKTFENLKNQFYGRYELNFLKFRTLNRYFSYCQIIKFK